MATDLSKYYAELRRLRFDNPKLDRTMLEDHLRVLYRDEFERLTSAPHKSMTAAWLKKDRSAKRPHDL